MDTIQKLFKVKAPTVAKSKLERINCSNPTLICGVELETENARHDGESYSSLLTSDVWRVDRDGSLRGRGAFEFISNPIELQYLLPELKMFFEKTKFNDTNYSDRCSVHVHTNVTDFNQNQLASLCMIYSVMEDVLFEYVNHHKSPSKNGYSRDTNLYCIPWNQCRMSHRLVEKLFSNPAGPLTEWQKYTALNLLPISTQGSVEWRHMHGTADMDKLTTWLNLISSIMQYATRTSLDNVIKTVQSLNDTSAYKQFFTDVLQDHLVYEDRYAATLSEGIINAKYALLDWSKEKIIVKPIDRNKKSANFTIMDEAVTLAAAAWPPEPEQHPLADPRLARTRPAPTSRVDINLDTLRNQMRGEQAAFAAARFAVAPRQMRADTVINQNMEEF